MAGRMYTSADIEDAIVELESLTHYSAQYFDDLLSPLGFFRFPLFRHRDIDHIRCYLPTIKSNSRQDIVCGLMIPKLQELQEAIEPGSSRPRHYKSSSPDTLNFYEMTVPPEFSVVIDTDRIWLVSKKFPEIKLKVTERIQIRPARVATSDIVNRELTGKGLLDGALVHEQFLTKAEASDAMVLRRTGEAMILEHRVLDRRYMALASGGYAELQRMIGRAASDNRAYEALKRYGFEFKRDENWLHVTHEGLGITDSIDANALLQSRLEDLLTNVSKAAQAGENALLALTADQNYRLEREGASALILTHLDDPERFPPLRLNCPGGELAFSKRDMRSIAGRLKAHQSGKPAAALMSEALPQSAGLKPIDNQSLFTQLGGDASQPALIMDSSALVNLVSPRRNSTGDWLGLLPQMAETRGIAPLIIVPASSADYRILGRVVTRDADGTHPQAHPLRGFGYLLPPGDMARLENFLNSAWRCFADDAGNRYLVNGVGEPVFDGNGKLLQGMQQPRVVIWESHYTKAAGTRILAIQAQHKFKDAAPALRDGYEIHDIRSMAAELPNCPQVYAVSRNYAVVAAHELATEAQKTGRPLAYVTLEHALQAFNPLLRRPDFREANAIPLRSNFSAANIIADYSAHHDDRTTRLSSPFDADMASAAALSAAVAEAMGEKPSIAPPLNPKEKFRQEMSGPGGRT